MNVIKPFLSFRVGYIGLLLLIFLLICTLNVIVYFSPQVGKIGVIVWSISYASLFLFALRNCYAITVDALFHKKGMVTFSVCLILLIIIAWNMTDTGNVSGETTEEIACTLRHFAESDDWGYAKTCLYGYPTRQFFLPAFPSLLFGRSLLTLHLGTYFYFFMAIWIFARGVLVFLGDRKDADFIGALVLSLMLHVHYVNHFMTLYEQSIYPFLFGLMTFGLLFQFYKTHTHEILLLLGFVFLYLIYSYTPSLALLGFVLCIMIYVIVTYPINLSRKGLIGVVIVGSLLSLVFSIMTRTDINFFSGDRSYDLLQQDLVELGFLFLDPAKGVSVVSPIFYSFFVLFLVSSLFLLRDWKLSFSALWIVAVFFVAVLSKGYVYYNVDFRIHRATVIFPVLFSMIVYAVRNIEIQWRNKLWYLGIILGVFMISGYWYHTSYVQDRDVNEHYLLSRWIEDVRHEHNLRIDSIYFDVGEEYHKYQSISNVAVYFAPGIRMHSFEEQNCSENLEEHSYTITNRENTEPSCFEVAGYSLQQIDRYDQKFDIHAITR